MHKTLEDLWYGNIRPFEQATEDSKSVQDAMCAMGDIRKQLCDTLTESQKAILSDYDAAVGNVSTACEQKAFEYGFRLGSNLMLAVLDKDL